MRKTIRLGQERDGASGREAAAGTGGGTGARRGGGPGRGARRGGGARIKIGPPAKTSDELLID